MADKYVLRVTAGPEYDIDKHVQVHVNKPDPVKIASDHMDIELNVRVQGYKGLPPNSPSTSAYFDHEPHAYNQDQYSIAFRFTPKRPKSDSSKPSNGKASNGNATESDEKEEIDGIPATDLQFGNDFDHPIRDRLPPGINAGMNILKWFVDPGLEGDVYADNPYLYGPALSSFNVVHIGQGTHDASRGGLWFEEGASSDEGEEYRKKLGCPGDGKARQKWALKSESKEAWVWGYEKTYGVDFFNPYVDFGELSIRLPGFHLPVVKYWDGKQGLSHSPKHSHRLRYVLRNRSTGQVYLVVLFTLHLKEDVNEDGSLKPAALKATAEGCGGGAGKNAMNGKDEAVNEDKEEAANGGGNDDDID
ncbi:Protein of unknown function (DUF1769) domain containing protein [Rhypophila sp. PSN 637]